MYGVVVCPRCRRAKGVELRQKTTRCTCGFEIRVDASKVEATAPTARKLAPLVARAKAEIAGGLPAYEKAAIPPPRRRSLDVHTRVVARVARAGNRTQRIQAAAIELTRELEVFSFEDWSRVVHAAGIPDAADALGRLLGDHSVYEPRPGFYRAVSLTP